VTGPGFSAHSIRPCRLHCEAARSVGKPENALDAKLSVDQVDVVDVFLVNA